MPRRRQPRAAPERRNKTYRVAFPDAGEKYGDSLDTSERDVAEALGGSVATTPPLLGQGLRKLPSGIDLVAFVKAGGKVEEPPAPVLGRLNLQKRIGGYLESHANGATEDNSLATVRLHLRHVRTTLGERFDGRPSSG